MERVDEVPARQRRLEDFANLVPVHVVWETTLACNLKCQHCGSRAGRPRSDELSTDECLDLIDQLARLGTRELSMIGGEAYLRQDWVELIRRSVSHGIFTAIQTGGRNLTDRKLDQAIDAELAAWAYRSMVRPNSMTGCAAFPALTKRRSRWCAGPRNAASGSPSTARSARTP